MHVPVSIDCMKDHLYLSIYLLCIVSNLSFSDRQIHIDIAPLVAAFRKDLLGPMKRGEIIPTPATIKGLQLLTNRMLNSPNLVSKISFRMYLLQSTYLQIEILPCTVLAFVSVQRHVGCGTVSQGKVPSSVLQLHHPQISCR